MRRIQVGEKQADRDRLHALFFQSTDRLARCLLIELFDHLAAEVESLGQSESSTARRDRFGRAVGWIPNLFFVSAANFDLVAMAFGGEQSGYRSVHLDHGVVAGGGAMNYQIGGAEKPRHIGAFAARRIGDAVHHALRFIAGRGCRFAERDLAARSNQNEVGEGTADIDADFVAHGFYFPAASTRSD